MGIFKRKLKKNRQLTSIGISLTGVSLGWEAMESERERAQKVMHHLEDHRMLYVTYADEHPQYVMESAQSLRTYLGGQIEQCKSDELRNELRDIQAALRRFLTRVGDPERYTNWRHLLHRHPMDELRILRIRVARAVTTIGETFSIPLDRDLESFQTLLRQTRGEI